MSDDHSLWPVIADDDPRREVAEHWTGDKWKQLLAELDNDDHFALTYRMPWAPSKIVVAAGNAEHEDCVSGSDGDYVVVAKDAALRVYQAMILAAYPEIPE